MDCSKLNTTNATANVPAPISESFAIGFGEPEPILDNSLIDFGSFVNYLGNYYLPPVSLEGLSKLLGANPYHAPILHFKKNMICEWHDPTPLLSTDTLRKAALDFVTFGNCYFQQHRNRFGKVVRLSHLPAIAMRPSINPDVYVQLLLLSQSLQLGSNYVEYQEGEVLHLKEYDVRQGIYGIPQYVGGIQSILLSEAATLFRRKYYVNGAHLGYILVTNDANIGVDTAKSIENSIKQGKGAGNFRSLYLNIPRSASREPVKVIPIGDIGTKDEYAKIKEVTEMEMCAMHRVYPSLVAIMPTNVGGFGDIQKTLDVYHQVEVKPLQKIFLGINERLGQTAVKFTDYQPDKKAA